MAELATGTNQDPAGTAADPRRWHALAVTQLAAFMVLLDVSIVNVALPSIERDLGISVATVQWVVSGYALTFGLAMVPAGRVGDAFGRRRMFLIALAAFVLASATCGVAPNAGFLVAARLVQGVAGGMLLPQNSGLIQELFRGAERGRAFGLLGGVIGLSTATGPVVGGLILGLVAGPDAWRWIFYVNVPIGLVALLLAARFVPAPTRVDHADRRLDLVGALLLGAGVFALLLPLVSSEAGGTDREWWLFAAALLLVGFGWWEGHTSRSGRPPLLDPRLVGVPGFSAGLAIALVYFSGFTGIWLVLVLFLQDGLGYSPLRSGLWVTPFALGAALSAVVAGRLVSRAGRWVTVCGLTAMLAGLVITALVLRTVGPGQVTWAAAAPLLVSGLGGGMVTSPNVTLTLAAVPTRMAGAAGGALQTAQRIGAAIGTVVLASVYYRVLTAPGGDFARAVSTALLVGAGSIGLALLLAAAELVRGRPGAPRLPSWRGSATSSVSKV